MDALTAEERERIITGESLRHHELYRQYIIILRYEETVRVLREEADGFRDELISVSDIARTRGREIERLRSELLDVRRKHDMVLLQNMQKEVADEGKTAGPSY